MAERRSEFGRRQSVESEFQNSWTIGSGYVASCPCCAPKLPQLFSLAILFSIVQTRLRWRNAVFFTSQLLELAGFLLSTA